MPVITVNELWRLVETAWATVPLHAIQSLYDPMSWHKTADFSDGLSLSWFIRTYLSKFLENLINYFYYDTFPPLNITLLFAFFPGVAILMASSLFSYDPELAKNLNAKLMINNDLIYVETSEKIIGFAI